MTYIAAHGNARSLTHRAGPGIEPTSSRIQVGLVTAEPQWELLIVYFEYNKRKLSYQGPGASRVLLTLVNQKSIVAVEAFIILLWDALNSKLSITILHSQIFSIFLFIFFLVFF